MVLLVRKKNPAQQQSVTRDGIYNHSGALLQLSGSSSRQARSWTARSLLKCGFGRPPSRHSTTNIRYVRPRQGTLTLKSLTSPFGRCPINRTPTHTMEQPDSEPCYIQHMPYHKRQRLQGLARRSLIRRV